MEGSKKILFFVRSVSPYMSNRNDVDNIIKKFNDLGHEVDIYDVHQAKLISTKTGETKGYRIIPKWINKSLIKLAMNFITLYFFSKSVKEKYHSVGVFYVREEFLILPNTIKRIGKKLILMHYGSDVNQPSWIKNNFTKLFEVADELLFTTNDLLEKQLNKLNASSEIRRKSSTILLPFDHLKVYRKATLHEKKIAKKKLNINNEKPLVVLGSNGTPIEQHLPALKQLNRISSTITLYIPLTDRNNSYSDYIEKITNYLKHNYKGEYIIQGDYFPLDDIFNLRLASDIYINVRSMDQLCLAMIESNLTYTEIITGNWLPYNWYRRNFEINSLQTIEDLSEAVEFTIENIKNRNYNSIIYNRRQAEHFFLLENYYLQWEDKFLRHL